MKKRAIIYARVSTQEQAESRLGIDSQIARCLKYAVDNDYDLFVGKPIVDEGVSAAVPLLERSHGSFFRTGSDFTIIALCQDRLFRSVIDMLASVERLQEDQVDFVTADEGPLNFKDDDRWLAAMMRCVFAELERRRGSSRTIRALEEVRKRGGKIGEAPYGWQNIGEARHAPNVAEQQVIEVMLAACHRLPSLRQVAKYLNDSGYRTRDGNNWTHVQVGRLLQYPSDMCTGCGLIKEECARRLIVTGGVDPCCLECSHV